ncbi:MAG: HAD-IIA family hydrolase [Spirochaetales bacterium]|jgi:HAD superfamily hydrolase (TIGR01458 family)|nr:HAD-IIA family hydrolase [Exilispira sp.]NMC68080.1 HAD-IIA family hydrolase [Spirochaetales bacterium]
MKKSKFDLILFDIDGVLEYQGKVFEGAIELVNSIRNEGIKVKFLTNSTLKSSKSATEKLIKRGFTVYTDEVITASFATAQYLKLLNPRSIWLLLAREGVEEFKDFIIDEENPEYVVIGDCRDSFNFNTMNKVLQKVMGGSKLIGMISELIDSSLGTLELNVGSWVSMIERAANVKATYIGKPNKFVFDLILKNYDIDKKRVLMVGDRISSDIVGAKVSGIKSCLVKQGEYSPEHLKIKAKPDFTINSISELTKVIFS